MNYEKVYDTIIEKARNEGRAKNNKTYYEAHHIIPQCLGGTGRTTQWKLHSNIILLTAKEHFICHKLLCKIHPTNNQLIFAFWRMCNQKNQHQSHRHVPSIKIYAEARIQYSRAISQQTTGKYKSEETKQRMSKAHIGVGGNNKGKKLPLASEERRQKQSDAHKKPIVHLKTGIKYESIVAAAKAAGVCVATLTNKIKTGEYKRVNGK